jgi:hypothetical protein
LTANNKNEQIRYKTSGGETHQDNAGGGDKVSETVQIFIYAGSSFKLLVFTQVHIFDKTIKIVTPSLYQTTF